MEIRFRINIVKTKQKNSRIHDKIYLSRGSIEEFQAFFRLIDETRDGSMVARKI